MKVDKFFSSYPAEYIDSDKEEMKKDDEFKDVDFTCLYCFIPMHFSADFMVEYCSNCIHNRS